MKPKKLYFGHAVNLYHTREEKELEKIINEQLPEYKIENPNKGLHTANYNLFKSAFGNGMLYFYQHVLPSCDAGIFLPFKDEQYGAGVWKEMRYMQSMDKPVMEINPNDYYDIKGVSELVSEDRALSVEETRERVY